MNDGAQCALYIYISKRKYFDSTCSVLYFIKLLSGYICAKCPNPYAQIGIELNRVFIGHGRINQISTSGFASYWRKSLYIFYAWANFFFNY